MIGIAETIRQALSTLVDADPDHAREINGVGLNKFDGPIVRDLLAIPWTPKQLVLAHRIATKYRRQVGPMPPLPETSAETSAETPSVDPTPTNEPEWGLRWSAPRTVNTRQGLRSVRSATPTAAFWSEWKVSKEGVKSRGYSLAKNRENQWEVTHWAVPTHAPDEVREDKARTALNMDASGLLHYQVPAFRTLVAAIERYNAALDASDTGVGKTYDALATARAFGVVPTVLCMRVAIPSWYRAADEMGVKIRAYSYEKIRAGNTLEGEWETVQASNGKSYDRFVWSKKVKFLIFDEVHKCKARDTQNALMLIAAGIQKIPTLCASASAVESPLDMRALGYLLGLHNLWDFYGWAEANGCHKGAWNNWEYSGGTRGMSSIHAQIFPDRGVRLRTADIPNFPKFVVDTKLVDVSSPESIQATYDELDRLIRDVHEKSKTDSDKAAHLTARLRRRQISEAQKIPAMVEYAEDALSNGRSVIIGVSFKESVASLMELLKKHRPVAITGDTDPITRQANIDAFQINRVHVMVLTVNVGGASIGLHDLHGRPRTSLLSPGDDSRMVIQFIGRTPRAGAKSLSLIHILYAKGTVEERIATSNEGKLRRMKAFNDGLPDLENLDLDTE
jgi:superfamily II DNA or RNA helicase